MRVLLALGSNLEPRKERITTALAHLRKHVAPDLVASKFYATAPVGFTDQPDFLNAVAVGTTTLTPQQVFDVCKSIEATIGRQHRERWREREIDIDVLLYGDAIVETDRLSIPHPRMHERRFVLVPAAEIAPDFIVHQPHTDPRTIADLLAACPDTSRVTVVD